MTECRCGSDLLRNPPASDLTVLAPKHVSLAEELRGPWWGVGSGVRQRTEVREFREDFQTSSGSLNGQR